MSTFEDTEADAEERTMEVEALEAIFMDDFKLEDSGDDALQCSISLAPDEETQHVRCVLEARAPKGYPSSVAPTFAVRSFKGLLKKHAEEMEDLARVKAAESEGTVCIFEVASAVRDWLGENNSADLADDSMYAAMLRRDEAARVAKEPPKETKRPGAVESDEARKQREHEEAEQRRLERLRYGTPVTAETFEKWRLEFYADILAPPRPQADGAAAGKKLTGKQFFEQGGKFEAEEAAADGDDDVAQPLDESLFVDDDVDDLDFDDDDDDETEDEDEDKA